MASSGMLETIADGAIAVGYAVGHWIYDFQTLITGAAAIGAAWYAGAPVWRQLKDSNLQTRIMHRETLAIRQREAEERAARVAQAIDGPLWRAQEVTSDPAGEPVEVGEHDAFGLEQMIVGTLNWYLVTLEGTEDARIEEAKAALKAALKDLTDTLGDVHRPASSDQHGEDYSFTDGEWAEIEQKAAKSKALATEKVSAAWKANRSLKAAQEEVVDELRQQIAALDLSIAKGT